MKLMVNHQTHYHYTQVARNSVQSIKMIPQSSRHQLVESWHISVPGQYTSKLDAFNNLWITANQRHDYHYRPLWRRGLLICMILNWVMWNWCFTNIVFTGHKHDLLRLMMRDFAQTIVKVNDRHHLCYWQSRFYSTSLISLKAHL